MMMPSQANCGRSLRSEATKAEIAAELHQLQSSDDLDNWQLLTAPIAILVLIILMLMMMLMMTNCNPVDDLDDLDDHKLKLWF